MTEMLAVSFAQEQIWFIDSFHDGFPAHNVPNLVWLRGPLDVPALERAAGRLVARHEALRTRPVAGPDGWPAQMVDAPGQPGLEVTDYALGPQQARERLRELAGEEALRPFRLAADRLFRVRLVRLATGEHVLVALAHRVVLDDWSFGVLLRELAALYRGEVRGEPNGLGEPPVQYGEYSARERQCLQGLVVPGLEDYWRDTLVGLPTSRFPTDRPSPLVASHDGAVEDGWRGAGAPATLTEAVLVDLYATVLGSEQAGATDSFFDVGGNSLQATQLVTRLRSALAVDLDVAPVFLALTPRQPGALLRDKHGFEDEELGGASTEWARRPGGRRGVRKQEVQTC